MPIHDPGASTDERLEAGQTRRGALDHLSRLLRITPKPRWATPTLIALGLGASFAETMGITLIILFFYSATGQADKATTVGGALGRALDVASGWFGSSTQMAAVILLLIVIRGALAFANSLISAYVSETISERARNLIHEQYLTVSYSFMQRHEQAQLMEVLGSESWLVAGAYGSLTKIIVSACSVAVFTGFLLALSWQITLIAIVGSLLLSLGLRRLSMPAQALGKRVKQVHQRLGEHMLMTLEGLRTIRAYGQEQVHQQRFIRSSAEAREASIALTRLSSLLHPLTEVGYLGILCVIIAGAGIWQTSFATTLAAVALLYRLQPYTREIESNLLYLAQIEPQLRSVRSMLQRDDKQYPSQGHRPLPSLRKGIRFDHVTFRYQAEATAALDDATFEIPAGQITALVGASGSGKTTIVNLLLGLYRPSSGTIWIDDMPLDEVRRSDWLRLLAVAGQDVDLIEGTVIDNIRMADNDATEQQVVEASRIAGVAKFIEPLPEGYETWIGQQGLRFSGGQRQRLGLARAILRDPDFLMLDEAMSALDRDLERRIRGAIEERFVGRTILIITHRLETLHNAHHLIRIEDGRVAPPRMGGSDHLAREYGKLVGHPVQRHLRCAQLSSYRPIESTLSAAVLVTGGAGYVGSHVCKALASAGFSPVTYDNLARGHEWAVRWGPLERGDLLDGSRLAEVLDRVRPVAVIHMAALAYVGESVADPAKYYRYNVAGTLSLLEAMRAAQIDRLVFSSTCATYGLPDAGPVGEDQPQRPVSAYGQSKAMVEQILRDCGHAYGMRSVSLRYFNAAGADPAGEIGEAHDPETHLIPLVLRAAHDPDAPISVYGSDHPTADGTCVRDYVHVQDIANAHVLALEHLDQGQGVCAFNLGTGQGHSVREIIDTARRVTGRDIATLEAPARPGDPPALVADASLARKVLGWRTEWSDIDAIIETAWRWERRCA